ncbi:hypothetical protein ISN44_As11g028530 [Arabidopsis suecica]|uniref:Uncharacterized protein n=1 Tax=Arabidopsis suecica TaxID=45249 RepID=A0A8T1ZFQ6_ARASU|nr:hypothetical protein ISN44_As11g028530 [Arabidopsis suecica]
MKQISISLTNVEESSKDSEVVCIMSIDAIMKNQLHIDTKSSSHTAFLCEDSISSLYALMGSWYYTRWSMGTMVVQECARINRFLISKEVSSIQHFRSHVKQIQRDSHLFSFSFNRVTRKISGFRNVPACKEVKEAIFRSLITNGMFDNTHIRLSLTRGKKVTSGISHACTLTVLAQWKRLVYDNDSGIVLVTATTRRNSPLCLTEDGLKEEELGTLVVERILKNFKPNMFI